MLFVVRAESAPWAVEDLTRIQLDDPVRLVVGNGEQRLLDHLATVGPYRVGVVDLDANPVDPDLVSVLNPKSSVIQQPPEVLPQQAAESGVHVDRLIEQLLEPREVVGHYLSRWRRRDWAVAAMSTPFKLGGGRRVTGG